MFNPSVDGKLTKVANGAASGTTAVTGTLDMTGFDGVIFFTSITTPAANNTIKVQGGAAANGSDGSDVAGSKVASGAAGTNVAIYTEIHHPIHQYLTVVVTRGTATVCGDVWAFQYGGKTGPVTNTAAGVQLGSRRVGSTLGTA